MRLSINLLLLASTTAGVHAVPGVANETREPRCSCRSVNSSNNLSEKSSKGCSSSLKAGKGSKAPKGTRNLRLLAKASKASAVAVEECSCPCCDLDTCQAFYDGDLSIGEDDWCAWGYDLGVCPSPADEVCRYNSDGELDVGGEDCFIDCCADTGCGGIDRRDRRLNENSASNKRAVKEQEDGVVIEVTAGNPTGLDWIKDHVDEMRQRMDEGDAVRTWDPLFKAYFENAEDIDMACIHAGGDVMSCKYSGASECAVDLIKGHEVYHSKIADSIRELGTHRIYDTHAVPESCQQP